jgi:hypothetical protein
VRISRAVDTRQSSTEPASVAAAVADAPVASRCGDPIWG